MVPDAREFDPMPTVTLDLPDTMTRPLPRNLGEVTVPLASLPPHVLVALIAHGARQKIADAFSDKEKDGAEPGWAVARAMAIVDAWRAGRWSTRGSAEPTDPREAIYRKAATDYCKKRPKAGMKLADRVAAFVRIMLDPTHQHHAALMANEDLAEFVRVHTAAAEAIRAAREATAVVPDDDGMPI
jgi:hypothetical protein